MCMGKPVCASCVLSTHGQARRGHQIRWNWSYRRVLGGIRMLGTKPWLSQRATSVLRLPLHLSSLQTYVLILYILNLWGSFQLRIIDGMNCIVQNPLNRYWFLIKSACVYSCHRGHWTPHSFYASEALGYISERVVIYTCFLSIRLVLLCQS